MSAIQMLRQQLSVPSGVLVSKDEAKVKELEVRTMQKT